MLERKDVKTHCDAINALVAQYCKDNGLAFSAKSVTYTGAAINYKCEVRLAGDSGYPELSELERMIIRGHMEEAPEDVKNADHLLGHSVYTLSGRVIKLVGFNRKKQYCWAIEIDGKQKICKNEMIDWKRGFAA